MIGNKSMSFFAFNVLNFILQVYVQTVSLFVVLVLFTIKFHAALTERKSIVGYKKNWSMRTTRHIARVLLV